MRVTTLNAWGGQEWAALDPWLRDHQTDVLCLQEVTRSPVAAPDWLVYRDPQRTLWQRADLFADAQTCRPADQAFFQPSARGALTDEAGHEVASEHGNAMLVHRDWTLAEQCVSYVCGAFRTGGWGEPPRPRPIHVVRVVTGEGPFVLAHFHGLHHPEHGKGDTPLRTEQTQRAIAAIRSVWREGEPLILVGDLNLLPDSGFFDAMQGLGLRNLLPDFGITDTRTTLYSKPTRWADYVLANDAIEAKSLMAPATPVVSDHRPLTLEFALR